MADITASTSNSAAWAFDAGANWVGGTAPGASDNAIVPSGVAAIGAATASKTVASLTIRNNAQNVLTNVIATTVDIIYSTNATIPLTGLTVGGGTIEISGGTWGATSFASSCAFTGTVALNFTGGTVNNGSFMLFNSCTIAAGTGALTATVSGGTHSSSWVWWNNSTVNTLAGSLVTAITGGTFSAARPTFQVTQIASGGSLTAAVGSDLQGGTMTGSTINLMGDNLIVSSASSANISGATINAYGSNIGVAKLYLGITSSTASKLVIQAANIAYIIDSGITLTVQNGEPNYPAVGNVRKSVGFGWNSTTLTGTAEVPAAAYVMASQKTSTATASSITGGILVTDVRGDTPTGTAAGGTLDVNAVDRSSISVGPGVSV